MLLHLLHVFGLVSMIKQPVITWSAGAMALSDRVVNRAHTTVDLGVGVRVVVGDQVGYAYTEDLSMEAMLPTPE